MESKRRNGTGMVLVLFLFVAVSSALGDGGDVYWHIDPSVKTCSMVIDPFLTQAQWHSYIQQVGAIATIKSLAPATPLGRKNFNISVERSNTPVDQHDPAWINTFTHPGVNCPLGDAIKIPAIRARMGVTDKMDAGVYWTAAPRANYGIVAGEVKYAFLKETSKRPAAAVRASVLMLTGVPDYNISVYSVEVMGSKKTASVTPYVGFRDVLAVGTETTSKVDLHKETVPFTQGYAGVATSIWKLNLAAEYNVAPVNTFAFAVGFNFGRGSRP